MHAVPGMWNGGIQHFGTYLDQKGFAPLGLWVAWMVKLSHLAAAVCLLLNRWLLWACLITMLLLGIGLLMVHLPHGWFVVGGGHDGVEYTLLVIAALWAILQPNLKTRKNGRE